MLDQLIELAKQYGLVTDYHVEENKVWLEIHRLEAEFTPRHARIYLHRLISGYEEGNDLRPSQLTCE